MVNTGFADIFPDFSQPPTGSGKPLEPSRPAIASSTSFSYYRSFYARFYNEEDAQKIRPRSYWGKNKARRRDIIENWHPKELKNLPAKAFAALRKETMRAMSPLQIQGIPPKKLQKLQFQQIQDLASKMSWKQLSAFVPSLAPRQVHVIHNQLTNEQKTEIYSAFESAKSKDDLQKLIEEAPPFAVIMALGGLYHGNGKAASSLLESAKTQETGLRYFKHLDTDQLLYMISELKNNEARTEFFNALSEAQKKEIGRRQSIEKVAKYPLNQLLALTQTASDDEIKEIAKNMSDKQKMELLGPTLDAETDPERQAALVKLSLHTLKLILFCNSQTAKLFSSMPKEHWSSLISVMTNEQIALAVMNGADKDAVLLLVNNQLKEARIEALLNKGSSPIATQENTKKEFLFCENSNEIEIDANTLKQISSYSYDELINLAEKLSDQSLKKLSKALSKEQVQAFIHPLLQKNLSTEDSKALMADMGLAAQKIILMSDEKHYPMLRLMSDENWEYLVPLMTDSQLINTIKNGKVDADDLLLWVDFDREERIQKQLGKPGNSPKQEKTNEEGIHLEQVPSLSYSELIHIASQLEDEDLRELAIVLSPQQIKALTDPALNVQTKTESREVLTGMLLSELKLILLSKENHFLLLPLMPEDKWPVLIPIMSDKQLALLIQKGKFNSGVLFSILKDPKRQNVIQSLLGSQPEPKQPLLNPGLDMPGLDAETERMIAEAMKLCGKID